MRVQSVLAPGLPLLIAAILLFLFRDYRTDDTYIYLQFARNLAEGAGFSFVPGEPTFGATSWLWTMLLAAGVRVGIDPLLVAKLWGVGFSLGSVVLVHALARQIFRRPGTAVFAACAWALHAWNLRWSASGLETPLMVFCLAWAWRWTILEGRQGLRPWRSGLGWALAILVRPEAVGLLGLALLRQVWRASSGQRGPRVDVGILALPSLVVVGSVLFWAGQTFGSPWPNSIGAKGIDGGWAESLSILSTGTKIVLATDGVFVAWILFAVTHSALRRRSVPWFTRIDAIVASDWFIPGVWSAVVFLLYGLLHSVIVSRYLVPESLVLVLAGFAVAERFRRLLVPATFVLAAVLNLGLLFLVVLPHTREFPRELDQSVGSIATWLRENTPPEATVGAIDIGLLAYESERAVVDLYGLANPEFVPLRRNLHIKDFVQQFAFAPLAHPDYLVDRQLEPNRLLGQDHPGVTLEPILFREVKALGIRRNSHYFYTLYRLHWEEPR